MYKNILKTSILALLSIIFIVPSHARLRMLDGPRAQWISKHKCAIVWQTSNYSTSKVKWGKSKNYDRFSTGDDGVQHQVKLDGLEGGTLYHYMVMSTEKGGQAVASEDFVFETPSPNLVVKQALLPSSVVLGNSYAAKVSVYLEGEPIDLPYTVEIFRQAYYAGAASRDNKEVKLGQATVNNQTVGTSRTIDVPFVVKPLTGLEESFQDGNDFVVKVVTQEKERNKDDNIRKYPFTISN
ncbi:MAG: fibronectin type III domain-containing protein [Candidatus Margulisiibacteriota bacterium]|nr:fibronectin type III domain-containing protein [Candidatus Margulisiibacteriota bacterium]